MRFVGCLEITECTPYPSVAFVGKQDCMLYIAIIYGCICVETRWYLASVDIVIIVRIVVAVTTGTSALHTEVVVGDSGEFAGA
jgi:hypothetical protein